MHHADNFFLICLLRFIIFCQLSFIFNIHMNLKKQLYTLIAPIFVFVGGVHASDGHALEELSQTELSGKASFLAAAMCGTSLVDDTSRDVEVTHSMLSDMITQLSTELDDELETSLPLRKACFKRALGAAMTKIHDHPSLSSLTLGCYVEPAVLKPALTHHLRDQKLKSLGLCAHTLVDLLAQEGMVEALKKCSSLSHLKILDVTLMSQVASILETIKDLPHNLHVTLTSFESGYVPSVLALDKNVMRALYTRGFQSLTLEGRRVDIGGVEEDFHAFLTGRTRPGRLTIKGDLSFDMSGLPFVNYILGYCLDGRIILEGTLLYREGLEYLPLRFTDPHAP